jgi:hypothetical protein
MPEGDSRSIKRRIEKKIEEIEVIDDGKACGMIAASSGCRLCLVKHALQWALGKRERISDVDFDIMP